MVELIRTKPRKKNTNSEIMTEINSIKSDISELSDTVDSMTDIMADDIFGKGDE